MSAELATTLTSTSSVRCSRLPVAAHVLAIAGQLPASPGDGRCRAIGDGLSFPWRIVASEQNVDIHRWVGLSLYHSIEPDGSEDWAGARGGAVESGALNGQCRSRRRGTDRQAGLSKDRDENRSPDGCASSPFPLRIVAGQFGTLRVAEVRT